MPVVGGFFYCVGVTSGQGVGRKLAGLLADAGKFSMVGVVGYILDISTFNVLRLWGPGWLSEPLVAKTCGVAVATCTAWLGSRYFTFRTHRRSDTLRELFEFLLVAVAGYLINGLVLLISHYLLGLRSLVADNISANIVGAIMGTVARFLAYRYWVYGATRSKQVRAGAPAPTVGAPGRGAADGRPR